MFGGIKFAVNGSNFIRVFSNVISQINRRVEMGKVKSVLCFLACVAVAVFCAEKGHAKETEGIVQLFMIAQMSENSETPHLIQTAENSLYSSATKCKKVAQHKKIALIEAGLADKVDFYCKAIRN